MIFSIRDGHSRPFGEVSIERWMGVKGAGFYRLVLTVQVAVRALEYNGVAAPAWLEDFSLAMSAAGKPIANLWLTPGQARVEPYTGASHTEQRSFECDLDVHRLSALEEIRNGADLPLTLRLAAQVGSTGRQPFPTTSDAAVAVTQSDWTRVLQEMGYQETTLLEVGIGPSASAEFKAAAASLDKAQQHIRRGYYVESVRECRVALESVEAAMGDAQTVLPEDARTRDKYARYLAVRRTIHSLASAAHHGDAVAASVEFHRSDALAVLAMVAAVVGALGPRDARP